MSYILQSRSESSFNTDFPFFACCSEQLESGQGRQEEAHEAHVQRATDLRAREDFRADQVPGGPGTGEARVRAGHDRVPSQGELSHARENLITGVFKHRNCTAGVRYVWDLKVVDGVR